MTEGGSIKITKAEKLPEGYYGKIDEMCAPKEYVRLTPPKSKLILPKKAETQSCKIIRKSKELIKMSSQVLSDAACDFMMKTGEKLKNAIASAKAGIKKISLNAAVSLGMFVLMIIFTACFCSVSYNVMLDGTELGTIEDKSDFNKLISEINDEILPYGETKLEIKSEPVFTPRLVLKGNVTSEAEFKERLKSTSADMLPAYAVTVEGIPVFALASEEMAKEVLTDYGNSFAGSAENAEISFLNEVGISHIFLPKTMLKTKESALLALADGKHIHYSAKDGDTLESIAQDNNVSLESIMLSNTISYPENLSGQELNIYTGEPIIEVKVVEHVNEVEEIACSTVTQTDAGKYVGTVDVTNEGKNGEKQVEAVVTAINGVEIKRDIISETILSKPVDRVEIIGTKEKPSPYGTGSFSTPTMGQLSSRYGSRWGRQHQGIDLAANEGTPIYAADNGTIIYSRFNDGGYGYLIEIDHSNGYVTYYAHCSKLVANEGDVVAKGDLIGYVGNTGRSTGAHLHFEVRKNGAPCDPMELIET